MVQLISMSKDVLKRNKDYDARAAAAKRLIKREAKKIVAALCQPDQANRNGFPLYGHRGLVILEGTSCPSMWIANLHSDCLPMRI